MTWHGHSLLKPPTECVGLGWDSTSEEPASMIQTGSHLGSFQLRNDPTKKLVKAKSGDAVVERGRFVDAQIELSVLEVST